MLQDMHNQIKCPIAIPPQVQTNDSTAIVGNIIDLLGFGSCEFVILYGGITDANVTFTTLLEDGNDPTLSDHAAVGDSCLLGTEEGATPLYSDDNTSFKLGYLGPKRYVRLTITPSGNDAGDINIAALAILGYPRVEPIEDQAVASA